jgi:DNA (cytosine-5)-methyltransferase 1
MVTLLFEQPIYSGLLVCVTTLQTRTRDSHGHMTQPLTCIDLFAGCGGLSLGLEQAGFHPLMFSEINKDAANTYLVNRADKSIASVPDVTALTSARLKELMQGWNTSSGEIDLVCGGPPCQGYSGIGHRRSYVVDKKEIPSNHLFLSMISVIKTVRPKVFLFENVKGLMSGRWTADGERGEIWEDVQQAFFTLKDYGVYPTLVQAKAYGVPQNRPRVLIAGIRRDVAEFGQSGLNALDVGAIPRGSARAPDLEDALGDLIDTEYDKEFVTHRYPHAAKTPYQRLMRTQPDQTIAQKGALVSEMEYSQHSDRVREKFAYMLQNGGEIPEAMQTKKFAQRVLPRRWSDDGPNITATSLADDFVHFAQPRVLTVREWARLQAFPDWYQFMGPRTTGGLRRAGNPHQGIWEREAPKYTQIGNAVPVRLAKAIGDHFRKLLR